MTIVRLHFEDWTNCICAVVVRRFPNGTTSVKVAQGYTKAEALASLRGKKSAR